MASGTRQGENISHCLTNDWAGAAVACWLTRSISPSFLYSLSADNFDRISNATPERLSDELQYPIEMRLGRNFAFPFIRIEDMMVLDLIAFSGSVFSSKAHQYWAEWLLLLNTRAEIAVSRLMD
jgi:hypothetical protein